jgi:hypothetical protein
LNPRPHLLSSSLPLLSFFTACPSGSLMLYSHFVRGD